MWYTGKRKGLYHNGKIISITAEQIAELEAAKAANRDKNIDKRLTALLMRAAGKRRKEMAE